MEIGLQHVDQSLDTTEEFWFVGKEDRSFNTSKAILNEGKVVSMLNNLKIFSST